MAYSMGYSNYGADISADSIASLVTGAKLPDDVTKALSVAGGIAKEIIAPPPPPPKKTPIKLIVIGLAAIGLVAYLAKTKLPEATR